MEEKIKSNMNEFAAMIKKFLKDIKAEIKDYKLNITTKDGNVEIEFYVKADVNI